MRARIKFTKVEDIDDVQEGDIIVVPHERGVKRRVLHLAPKTWSKLGLHVTQRNIDGVRAMFGDPEHTVMHVLVDVYHKYCPDADLFPSVTNKIGTPGSLRRPVRAVRIAPFRSTSSAQQFRNELIEDVKASLDYGMLLDSLPEIARTSANEPDIPSKTYRYSGDPDDGPAGRPLRDRDIDEAVSCISRIRESGTDSVLTAEARFLTSLRSRGASVIRAANDATRMFIAKTIIKRNSAEVDGSMIRTSSEAAALIACLRAELAHLQDIRKRWRRFYDAHTGPVSEASEAAAKAAGMKKEDIKWS